MILSDKYSISEDTANVFIYGESDIETSISLIEKNMVNHEGSLVVLDTNNLLLKRTNNDLEDKNFRVVKIDFNNPGEFKINPFDCFDGEDGMYAMDPIFFAMCRETRQEDAAEMLTLCRAFSAYLYEKVPAQQRNFNLFIQLLASIRQTYQLPDGSVLPKDQAFFLSLNKENPESKALSIYKDFVRSTVSRNREIAEKLLQVFAKIPRSVLTLLSETTIGMKNIFDEKTVLFINAMSEEDRLLQGLYIGVLNNFMMLSNPITPVIEIIWPFNKLPKISNFIVAMNKMKTIKVSQLVYSNDLSQYTNDPDQKEYWDSIEPLFDATVMIPNRQSNSDAKAFVFIKNKLSVYDKIS